VMQEELPANPYTGLKDVQKITDVTAATKRTVSNPAKYGWNYFVDNSATPPVAIFWANSTDVTTIVESTKNGNSTYFNANEL